MKPCRTCRNFYVLNHVPNSTPLRVAATSLVVLKRLCCKLWSLFFEGGEGVLKTSRHHGACQGKKAPVHGAVSYLTRWPQRYKALHSVRAKDCHLGGLPSRILWCRIDAGTGSIAWTGVNWREHLLRWKGWQRNWAKKSNIWKEKKVVFCQHNLSLCGVHGTQHGTMRRGDSSQIQLKRGRFTVFVKIMFSIYLFVCFVEEGTVVYALIRVNFMNSPSARLYD